jgi:hypothetical protein
MALETKTWEEVDVCGSLPRTARPLVWVTDGQSAVYVFGGFDGKIPLGHLVLFDVENTKWKLVKLWLELDDSAMAVSSAGIVLSFYSCSTI